jgi:hypothetical protein
MSFSEAMRELARIGATLTDREQASIDRLGYDHLPHPLVQEGAQRLSLLLQGKSEDVTAENIWWAVEELAYTTDREHFSPLVIGVLALAQLCMYVDLNHPTRFPSVESASLDVVEALEHWLPDALPLARKVLAWVNASLSIQYEDERLALSCVIDALHQCETIRADEREPTAQNLQRLRTVHAATKKTLNTLLERKDEE